MRRVPRATSRPRGRDEVFPSSSVGWGGQVAARERKGRKGIGDYGKEMKEGVPLVSSLTLSRTRFIS